MPEKIIKLLKSSQSAILEEEVYAGWKNVEHFYNLYHKKQKKGSFAKLYKYAAVFIFAFAIGSTVPYFYFKSKQLQLNQTFATQDVNQAKLILSDGNEIILVENKNELQINSDGEVTVNDKNVINEYSNENKNSLSKLVLPYGMIKSDIRLSDGTRVWLNAGSTLIFPQQFEKKERKVTLIGEAYFDVAKNKDKPFVVNANEINVAVLGTKFNLKNNVNDDNLEVVLVEGSVSIKENQLFSFLQKEIILEPNQRAVYNKLSNKTEVTSDIDTDYYTSWKEGILKFNRESIVNVFKRLSRFYNVQFVTEKDVELYRKISGKLDLTASLEDVLKVISDAAPISYQIENNKVYVSEQPKYLPMK